MPLRLRDRCGARRVGPERNLSLAAEGNPADPEGHGSTMEPLVRFPTLMAFRIPIQSGRLPIVPSLMVALPKGERREVAVMV